MAKKLEDWQEADARRLAHLFKVRSTLSQLEFGAAHGIGNQSMVSQYLRGVRPLNIVAATKFAQGLGVSIDEFSPTLAQQIHSAWLHTDVGKQRSEGQPQSHRTKHADNLEAQLDNLFQETSVNDGSKGRQRRRPK